MRLSGGVFKKKNKKQKLMGKIEGRRATLGTTLTTPIQYDILFTLFI